MSFPQEFKAKWETNEAELRRLREDKNSLISDIERRRYERHLLCLEIILKLAGQSPCGLSGRPELAGLIDAAGVVAQTVGVRT